MAAPAKTRSTPAMPLNGINWVASDPLPRDQQQSRRLHEPAWLINTIDPITGDDILDHTGHPSLVDGNLTIYFESEATRKEFIDTPKDHPFHLVDNPDEDGEAEG